MSSRKAFGMALRMWRLVSRARLGQVGKVSASFIAYVEKGEKGVSLEKSQDLSKSLGLHPLTLILTSYALEHGQDLTEVLAELNLSLQHEQGLAQLSSDSPEPEIAKASLKLVQLGRGISPLEPLPSRPQGEGGEGASDDLEPQEKRRVRTLKCYRNPYTNVEVNTRTLAHSTLRKWREQYGDEEVKSWGVPFE